MKKALYAFSAALVLLMAGCKKDDTASKADQQSVDQSEDNNFLKSESDQANTDATDAVGNYPGINGGRVEEKQVCGCTITQTGPKTILLTYDGITPCGTNPRRRRSGKIQVELVQGNRWADQGAKLALTFQDYKVTRERDDRSVTLNGVKYMTNVRGTNWLGILAQTDSLVIRERADSIRIAYDNGAVGKHSLARLTSWKWRTNPDRFVFRASGDGGNGLDSWGTGRFGNNYTSTFTRAWLSNTYCGLGFPNSGQVVAESGGSTLTITLGVDKNGSTDTRDCAYGWKLDWRTAAGATGSTVVSY